MIIVECKKYVYKNKKTGKYYSNKKDYYSLFTRNNKYDSKKLTDAMLFNDYVFYPEYEHITDEYEKISFFNEERKIKLKTLNKKTSIKVCIEKLKSILSILRK